MDLFNTTETIIVLDFETTGMTPENGDRAIEVGAVVLRGGEIADTFQSLINPGFLVTREIEGITGITNDMLIDAPPATEVMEKFVRFIGTYPLVAHNASFDQKFLEAELTHLGKNRPLNFGCTLQVARRLYPDVINYKLETLARYKGLPIDSRLHRGLADAELAALLWRAMCTDLEKQFGFEHVDFELMKKIGRLNRDNAHELIQKEAESSRKNPTETTGSLFG